MTKGLHLSPRHREEIEALQDSTIPFLVEVRDWARLPESFHSEIKHKHMVLIAAKTPIERVRELDYVLTPGRYVGLPDDEDDFDFNERFTKLKTEFEEQLKEEEKLNALILENLKKVKVNG